MIKVFSITFFCFFVLTLVHSQVIKAEGYEMGEPMTISITLTVSNLCELQPDGTLSSECGDVLLVTPKETQSNSTTNNNGDNQNDITK